MSNEKFYVISDIEVQVLRSVARRLYTEDRLGGDDMRDLAQRMHWVLSHLISTEMEREEAIS